LTDFAVTVSPAARRDLDDYIIWLRGEDDLETATRFAMARIRKWRVQGFSKMLIFFRPRPGGVEIVRVLHAAQDWWALLDLD
jgi:plasmid stabilization system protein ParE